MERKKLCGDLGHLYLALLHHPLLIDAPGQKEAFTARYHIIKGTCMDRDRCRHNRIIKNIVKAPDFRLELCVRVTYFHG